MQRRWVGSVGLVCDVDFGESTAAAAAAGDLKKRFERREKYVFELARFFFLDDFVFCRAEVGDIKTLL
jgi:hypothetical protein